MLLAVAEMIVVKILFFCFAFVSAMLISNAVHEDMTSIDVAVDLFFALVAWILIDKFIF